MDGLFFAVTDNVHPESHILSFLRYVPCESGERRIGSVSYRKLSSGEAYEYLNTNHPEYLFEWNVKNKLSMGVPWGDVDEILSPIDRLAEILGSGEVSGFYDKIRLLADTFHDECGISYDCMGVTGSVLLGLEDPGKSDIDFVVYGIENHKRAVGLYSRLKEDNMSPLNKISGDYWGQVYEKRIKDDSMTLDEFMWYESRKNNRGLVGGTLFDILCSMGDDDVIEEPVCSRAVSRMRIECEISDDTYSYSSPAIYSVRNVKVLDGSSLNIEKIISFTHTYTGIVKNNERVIASGVCEEATYKNGQKKYNLIVGTTRESINEYVKLK